MLVIIMFSWDHILDKRQDLVDVMSSSDMNLVDVIVDSSIFSRISGGKGTVSR